MSGFWTTLSNVAFVSVHIFGLSMAVFLLIKFRSIPAVFAAIGFGLFLAEDIGAWILSAKGSALAGSFAELERVYYVCGCVRLLALIFLVIAIGQAITIRGRRAKQE
jgi:hypothetical protein